jgi:hypothetical protein
MFKRDCQTADAADGLTRGTTCLASQWAMVSGEDRVSLETRFECETDRLGRIRSHERTGSRDLSGWQKSTGEIMTTNVQRISDAEYAAALAAGRIEVESEIRAQAVRYVPDRDAIEIVTSRNAGFLIPRQCQPAS